jgi:probable phosphoglycerate mutase
MRNALVSIAAENPGKTVAVVSHEHALRFLLDSLSGQPGDPMQTTNAAVSLIEAEGDSIRLASRDDLSHLADESCRNRERPDFDTDMYFHDLPWLEYGAAFAESVEAVWQDSGEEEAFDRQRQLEMAALLPTTVGFVNYEPAGFLQMGMEPGLITLLCTHPGCRGAGLGAQLIGQAVEAVRAQGAESLRIALPKKNPYRDFFSEHGFVSVGETDEYRLLLEKKITPKL